MSALKGVKRNIRRIGNLYRASAIREFFSIIGLHFIKGKFDSRYAALQRLLIFSTACSDRNMAISKYSPDLLLVRWEENGQLLKMLVRKYTRDLMVFSEFFLDDGYLSDVRQIDKKQDVHFIVDAGANIGCSALFLSAYLSNAQLVCVEPETSNFDLLQKNISLNGLSGKIKCLNKALWNSCTHLDLMQRDWSSDAYHVMDKKSPDEIISRTETTTIPKIMEDCHVRSIDFLKIDIEGAEKALFEDEEQLSQYLPCTKQIAMEVHEEFISTSKIGSVLESFGFNIRIIPEAGESSFVIAKKF